MSQYNRSFGQWGEDFAAAWLVQQGYIIIERNWRTKFGEIDIIARREAMIYFFEVKSRSSRRYGQPYEAVTWYKKRNLINAAQMFIQQQKNYGQYNIQFGVIGYVGGRFTILPSWSI